jgi:endonuclease YncB( thermonuclease family)
VIDGDTLLLNIDLGFKVIKEQRVRLTQIDAAEMKTEEGKKSFKYLRDLAAGLDVVVVKTSKVDIYGRYLGDVFYPAIQANNRTTQSDIFRNGVYLNEELVKKGFAKVI